MAGIAVNRLGVTPAEFYMFSPVEFYEALHDYQQQEQQKLELFARSTYEAARLSSYFTIKYDSQIKASFRRQLKLSDLCEFSWEERKRGQSIEDMKEAIIAIHVANYMKRRKKLK